jgi:hypothetical protein
MWRGQGTICDIMRSKLWKGRLREAWLKELEQLDSPHEYVVEEQNVYGAEWTQYPGMDTLRWQQSNVVVTPIGEYNDNCWSAIVMLLRRSKAPETLRCVSCTKLSCNRGCQRPV